MRHLPLRELGYAIGFIVLLTALYVGAYYAMVERHVIPPDRVDVQYPAHFLEGFFYQMHEIDRSIRPEFWENEILQGDGPSWR